MVKNLSGWIDYDRPYLSSLGPNERVLYFRKRISTVLLPPLRNLLSQTNANPKYSPLLIFGTTLCCGIEAMGKFRSGGSVRRNSGRFYAFTDEYMHPDLDCKILDGKKYKEILWNHYRNGLAHGFAVCHGGFEGIPSYFEVRQNTGHNSLIINPERLHEDFRSAVAKYLRDLRIASPSDTIRLQFDTVFTDVFINGN